MTDAPGAIVLAAGLGTRMRSARTKVLHELGGEPMIARVMRSLVPLGASPLVVVVGHQGGAVAAAAGDSVRGLRVEAALQPAQKGTGDAARCGLAAFAPDFDGDVLILYGDMPMIRAATLQTFIAEHRRAGAAVSFISATMDDAGAYGRVVRDDTGTVAAIVEARDASPAELAIREINMGVYLARAAVLRAALAEMRPNNAQGEYYLTDLVGIVRRGGAAVRAWRAPAASEFAGINSLKELAQMEAEIRAAVNRKLMDAGVTIVDPATAYIGEQVEIGRDSTVGPNVQILGRSKLGEGVRIEGTAYLRDVEIGDGCHLKLGVRAEECRIGPHCEIGPFANLRTGTVLEGRNRIGNFVETKKARLGEGTKASHLSYLGDTEIGRETNIGCGVITVNYDGYEKHLTRIGSRCMIGCDTQLVAPVTVGDDVYVASGTTILREVPDGALCVSHHPQKTKPGWTADWRRRHSGRAEAKGSD
ncbi:MAG TPA: bifunctional UDP-N-acetylglucosamine diphosphorylase/glucosamine-1-phosphate N-acetyltransferase GlmU [Candidatus Binataceae bacterium]|jgi:bifunctional UDP-N-acetylglucosamine pyrophosphorylase/glucosamine-1-phosphate N-acetyltransferase